MKVLLKTQNSVACIYWLKYESSSGIVGWSYRTWEQRLPGNEMHFRYPADGDYHYSFKFKENNSEQYITGYWNRIKIKSKEKNNQISIKEIKRKNFSDKTLMYMIPGIVEPVPLKNVKFHAFPLLAIGIKYGKFNPPNLNDLSNRDISKDDLIIDISKLDNSTINIHGYIRAETHPAPLLEFERYIKEVKIPNNRFVGFTAYIIPK